MQKPFILFITGISASGKSTLYESLQKDRALNSIEFHDIDEDGVPDVGRSPWRSFRVQELLHRGVKNLKNRKSTIISGISKPHEVIESKLYKPDLSINFLLLDIPISIYEKRMEPRLIAAAKHGDNEANLEDFKEENLITTKNLRRVLRNTILNLKSGYFIDTSTLSKTQMHDEALKVIKRIQLVEQIE